MAVSRRDVLAVILTVAMIAACSRSAAPTPAANASASTNTMNDADRGRHVIVNGVELDASALAELDSAARTRVPSGDYWYDARCGACGAKGGPTAAFVQAGLSFSAPLRADASGGGAGRTTGVFVNGRELHAAEVQALARLGPILPGRYWLDEQGNWGVEGNDWPLGNLSQAASANAPGYNRSTAGGHLMSDGQSAGWFDPKSGASVLVGD